jgi:hypothetical protein
MDSTDATPAPARTARALTGTALSMLFRSVGVTVLLALPMVPGSSTPGDHSVADRVAQHQDPVWKTSYSQRYPGCVPTVLWPADENPVAVVTRRSDGRIDRVALDDQRHLVRPVDAGERTIGACR